LLFGGAYAPAVVDQQQVCLHCSRQSDSCRFTFVNSS
jgi:hypothetical protein